MYEHQHHKHLRGPEKGCAICKSMLAALVAQALGGPPLTEHHLRAGLVEQAALLDRLISLHQPVGGYLGCNARSYRPIAVPHPHRLRPVLTNPPVALFCSAPSGHPGDHVDGVHCWTSHRFSDAVAVHPKSHRDKNDWRRCGCGLMYSQCVTARLLADIGLAPPQAR